MSKSKVITDQQLIDRFLDWAVDKILPTKEGLEKKLRSGEGLTAYMGFDPTGPYLHVGHAMGIRALRILQQLGHRVIFLVGDYTARVGDPDKDSTRELLTPEKISQNMQGWKEQASQIIDFEDKDNPVEFLHNYEWLSKLNLEELIKLMSTTTVQQMMERDLFARRLKENNPIQLQEFIYPLMQGYDSVAMEVDLELGGTDQIFNMMVGRDLVKKYLNKEKFVRAQQMMPAPDGITMSKTKGNGINLSDSAADMYGIAMSYSDEQILTGLRLLTDTTKEELKEIEQALEKGENPMDYKKLMAYRIVELIKGKSKAKEAQAHFEKTVQGEGRSEKDTTKISQEKLSKRLDHLKKQGDIATIISEMHNISKSQAKQLVKQGGVEVNEEKITDLQKEVNLKINDIIKVGKRNWYEIVE
jgi:tyrosyl-tRNA synthetase